MIREDNIPGKSAAWWLIAAVLPIVVATLVPTSASGGASGPCLLCGDRGLADFILNLVLFAPLGAALRDRRSSLRHTLALGALLSAGIEVAQVGLIAGRDASIGDLVSNSLGAGAGWGAWQRWRSGPVVSPSRWASGASAIALAAVLLGGLLLLIPAFPQSTWYAQWTAEFGNLEVYGGRVLASRIGRIELGGPPWRIAESADVARRLLEGEAVVVDLIAGPPPAGTAPIFSIYDEREREMLLLGADGDDLIYRTRMRADAFLLDHGQSRFRDALRGIETGDTVRVSVTSGARRTCLRVEANRAREPCIAGFRVGDTWTLLYSLDRSDGPARTGIAAAWLAGLAALAALVFRAAPVPRVAVPVLAVLWVAPRAVGFTPTPLWQLGAIGIGWLLAARLLQVRRDRMR